MALNKLATEINKYTNISTFFFVGHGSPRQPAFEIKPGKRFPNATEFNKSSFSPNAISLWASCNSWKYAKKFTTHTGVTSLGVEGTAWFGSVGISAGRLTRSSDPGTSKMWIFRRIGDKTKTSGPYRININRGFPFFHKRPESVIRDPFEPPWPINYELAPFE